MPIRESAPLCLTGTLAGGGSMRLGVDRRPASTMHHPGAGGKTPAATFHSRHASKQVSPRQGTGMSRTLVRLAVLSAATACPTAAQNIHPTPPPDVRAVPLEGESRPDGRADEPVWRTAPAATDFRQAQPREGQPATQRTEVQFAFDVG